jgi:eukaryotic-like serine/threonine-protein kinase
MSLSFATKQILRSAAALRTESAGSSGAERVAGEESNSSAADSPVRLGPWSLESLLAEGELARVYQARPADGSHLDAALQVKGRYALKQLWENWESNSAAVARIRQEAMVGRCVAHRHLAPVLSAHVHKPPYYVVMPLLEGASVAVQLALNGQLSTPQALWIARQTAQGLEALHTAGYVHGDVKPANILVATSGHAMLIDLTCSRRTDEELALETRSLPGQAILGTPNYMAPEVFLGRRADPRSDLYSLGMTLLEMLAGRLPAMPTDLPELIAFKRGSALPSVRLANPGVPIEVAELIRQLTARDPLRRPDSAREVVQTLMRLEIGTLRDCIP